MKSITETLKTLIASHGEEIINQPQRLKAMLADLLPFEKRKRYLLDLSLQADIPKTLMAIQNETSSVWDAKINALKHYFKEEYFLEEKPIKLIFDCWVEVMPRIVSAEIKPDTGIQKKVFKTVASVLNTQPDIDGHVYKTIRLGNQVWMDENLRVTKYRNGDLIPNVKESEAWGKLSSGAWCNYNNDSHLGKLYNWYAVNDNRNIAPVGWHVPSDEEWAILTKFLGGDSVAAKYMKFSTNYMGVNYFCALLTGLRDSWGQFSSGDYRSYWWSSTLIDNCPRMRYIALMNNKIYREFGSKQAGMSVRCIKD